MDIYENVVIGNFLFELGLVMGKEKDVPLMSTPTAAPLQLIWFLRRTRHT
jgi:hypothetical protein